MGADQAEKQRLQHVVGQPLSVLPTSDWQGMFSELGIQSESKLKGEIRILLEFKSENQDYRRGISLAEQYRNFVLQTAETLSKNPNCDISDPNSVLLECYKYLVAGSIIKIGYIEEIKPDATAFERNSLGIAFENMRFDCDTSATLMYDVAKVIADFDIELSRVPNHAFLKIGDHYFETTGGFFRPATELRKYKAYITSQNGSDEIFYAQAYDQTTLSDAGSEFTARIWRYRLAHSNCSQILYRSSMKHLAETGDYQSLVCEAQKAQEFAEIKGLQGLSKDATFMEAVAWAGQGDFQKADSLLARLVMDPDIYILKENAAQMDKILSGASSIRDTSVLFCKSLTALLVWSDTSAKDSIGQVSSLSADPNEFLLRKLLITVRKLSRDIKYGANTDETLFKLNIMKNILETDSYLKGSFLAGILLTECYRMIGDKTLSGKLKNKTNELLEGNPESYLLLTRRGTAYYNSGEYRKAIKDFSKARKIAKDSQDSALQGIANCAVALKKFNVVQQAISRLVSFNSSFDNHVFAARILISLGDENKSQHHIFRSLDSAKNSQHQLLKAYELNIDWALRFRNIHYVKVIIDKGISALSDPRHKEILELKRKSLIQNQQ